jgi:hypothetical protein
VLEALDADELKDIIEKGEAVLEDMSSDDIDLGD